MQLDIERIKLDRGTQPRLNLDMDLVKDYAEKMRDGVEFPPVDVFFDGGEYILAAGFNRLHATKSNGNLTIECNLFTGTIRDAKFHAWKSNNTHGEKLKSGELRSILNQMLDDEEYSQWSNKKIAKELGVSSMTVGRVRVAREEQSKEPEPTQRKYIDKNGNEKMMETSNIGKKPEEYQFDEPQEKANSEHEYDPTEDRIRELMNTITALVVENTELKDQIAIGQWNASEIEKLDIMQVVADLREQIRIAEIENKAIRESRDMFQNKNAELIKTVNWYKQQLKKVSNE